MFLVPYRKTEISSPHSPAIVTERLRQRNAPTLRRFIGQQLNQAGRITGLPAQNRDNEVDVFGRELDPAIGLNHFHMTAISNFNSK